MNGVAYLAVGGAMTVVLSTLLWLTQRRPRSLQASVEEFRREMEALAPAAHAGPAGERARRGSERAARGRPEPIIPAAGHGDLARRLRAAQRPGGGRRSAGTRPSGPERGAPGRSHPRGG